MRPTPDTRAGQPGGEPAGEARLLASGALLQQLAQGLGLVALLVIVTLLARRLSLAGLGAYGLIATLAGYLLVLRNSLSTSAVRAMAAATDDRARASAFSAAAALYGGVGVLTGLLIGAAGLAISGGILSGELAREARGGALLLGAITAAGIAASVYLDALRAARLLVRSAVTEIVAVAIQLGTMLLLILAADASLWLVIGASGGLPLISGTLSALVVRASGLPHRLRREGVTREQARALIPTAGYLLVVEAANLVMYAFDRVILGAFASPATVGLYEGPVRAHNLFYAMNGALTVTTVPTASRYVADNDLRRLRELVVRGSRYTLALVVPLVVTLIALGAPILEVWLGERFREGAAALSLLVSYWLLYGALGVTPGLLVGAGKARELARYVSIVALANLALSLALTPALGLEGPALGTAIPFLLAFPFVLRLTLSVAPVSLVELWRTAWLPAYSLGLLLAACLVAVRLAAEPESLAAVGGLAAGGVLAYWLAYYLLWLGRDERTLVRSVLRLQPS